MTLAKHSASSTEVSKREVFWLLALRNFQHSQLFSTLFFTVFQHCFCQATPAIHSYCIPALNACISAFSSLSFCVHVYCVPACCVRARKVCSSTACVHFRFFFTSFLHTFLLYSSMFAPQKCISTVLVLASAASGLLNVLGSFLDCSGLLLGKHANSAGTQ